MNKREVKNLFIKQCPSGDHPLKPGHDASGALICRMCGEKYKKVNDWNVGRLVIVFFATYIFLAAALTGLLWLFGSKGSVSTAMLVVFAAFAAYATVVRFEKVLE